MIAVATFMPSPHLNLVQSSGPFNCQDCLFRNIAKNAVVKTTVNGKCCKACEKGV